MARKSFPTAPQVEVRGFPDVWNWQLVTTEAVSMSRSSGFSSLCLCCRFGLIQGRLPQASQACDFRPGCDPGYSGRCKTSLPTRMHFSQGWFSSVAGSGLGVWLGDVCAAETLCIERASSSGPYPEPREVTRAKFSSITSWYRHR